MEDKVKLSLQYLRLKQNYKALLSEVSHDLASPLGYLKFSTDILVNQIDDDANKDLKETARVISSSTSKLTSEAKQIVENGRTQLNSNYLATVSLKDVLQESLYYSGFQPISGVLKGDLEIPLKDGVELQKYILSSLLSIPAKLELQLESIETEKHKKGYKLSLNFYEHSKIEITKFKNEILKLDSQPLYASVTEYLNLKIISSVENEKNIKVNLLFD